MCSNHKLAYTVCKSCDKNNNVLLQAGPLYLWGIDSKTLQWMSESPDSSKSYIYCRAEYRTVSFTPRTV